MKKITKSKKIITTITVLGFGVILASQSLQVPTTNAATDSTNTTINANVSSTISVSTSVGSINLAVIPTSSGTASSQSHDVAVSTNNSSGYILYLNMASDATNNSLNKDSDYIAAHNGTDTVPSQLSVNTWGYRIEGGSFGSGDMTPQTNVANLAGSFAGMPMSPTPVALKNTSAPSNNDTTSVLYGVKVDGSKPSGQYSNTVVYTAITK